jgi:nucleoside-diphosphate-sugar epimerase
MNAPAQKKIVVFGATGTIGKAVLAALLPKYQVSLWRALFLTSTII